MLENSIYGKFITFQITACKMHSLINPLIHLIFSVYYKIYETLEGGGTLYKWAFFNDKALFLSCSSSFDCEIRDLFVTLNNDSVFQYNFTFYFLVTPNRFIKNTKLTITKRPDFIQRRNNLDGKKRAIAFIRIDISCFVVTILMVIVLLYYCRFVYSCNIIHVVYLVIKSLP